jgi:hypothetical protein
MVGTFAQSSPWTVSPFGTSGIGGNPWVYQPQFAQTPTGSPYGGYGTFGSYSTLPAQQIMQSLQIVPQQLQQLLQLAHVQQQQVQYLLQVVPQQIQQLQQVLAQATLQGIVGQPFGNPFQHASPGAGTFGGQPGYLM